MCLKSEERRLTFNAIFVFPQQTLREKWCELQALGLQEKRLTQGEDRSQLSNHTSFLTAPRSFLPKSSRSENKALGFEVYSLRVPPAWVINQMKNCRIDFLSLR